MSDENIIVAVDLGSTHVTLMAAEVIGGQVKVLAVESSNVKNSCVHNGIVINASGLAYQIADLSKKLNNSLRLKKSKEIKSMYVSVNAKTMKCVRHTISRTFLHFTKIDNVILSEMKAECQKMISQGNIAVYDIEPINFQLDDEQFDQPPVGQKGYKFQITYNVVIGNNIIENNLLEIFKRTPTLQFKIFKPLSMKSLAEAVLSQEDYEDGVALINLGATTTTLALYLNGFIHTLMVVPLGSHSITKDIQALGVSESNAEKLKRLKGVAMESMVERPERIIIPPVLPDAADVKIETPLLAKIIQARLNEMLSPIFEELQKYKKKIGAGIVLTGGGSNMNGILEYIQQKTEIYTSFGDHADKLTSNTDEYFTNPFYSQLVGMSLLIESYRNVKENNDDVIRIWDKIIKIIPKIPRINFDDDNPL